MKINTIIPSCLEQFGVFVLQKRNELGYSKSGVAQAINTSPSVIGDIEKGTYNGLKMLMMNRILHCLHSDWAEFGHFYAKQILSNGGGDNNCTRK